MGFLRVVTSMSVLRGSIFQKLQSKEIAEVLTRLDSEAS